MYYSRGLDTLEQGYSDQENDLLFLSVLLGVMMFVVLWLFLESIEVKVHEARARFPNANVTGTL